MREIFSQSRQGYCAHVASQWVRWTTTVQKQLAVSDAVAQSDPTERMTPLKCALGCCLSADPSGWLRLTNPLSAVCQRSTVTHTHTHTDSGAERTDSIHLSNRAPCQTTARYIRGERRQRISNQELTTNGSWGGWRSAPGDHTCHGGTKIKTACLFNCLLQPANVWGITYRPPAPGQCPCPKLQAECQHYWIIMMGCQSCLENRDRWR